jgi:DNA polymerase III delta prime subunit
MSRLPLVEKYRPSKLDDIISQPNNIAILKEAIHHKQIPHMLFYGPAGTGKTSTILALSKEYYGVHYKEMILELNGSDDRGINIIRSQIKYFSKIKNLTIPDKPKIIILDEADSLTYDAQFALRRVMEKYTTNVRFCLICNYLNKLIPAIQSRCTLFRFSTVKYDQIYQKLVNIVDQEKIKISKKKIGMIIELSAGDFRKNLNYIEQNKLDEYQYFLGVNRESYVIIENLFMKKNKKYVYTKDILQNVISQNKINFSDLMKIISHIAFKNKMYNLISKLAEIEYKYYLGNNLFDSIFLEYLIIVLLQ